MANQQLSRQYAQDFSKLVGKYAVAGSPDDCVARIQEFVDAGVLAHGCAPHYHETNTRLIAGTVLPAFH
jgi:alkanesulfonate monooxygenase SsuD/methylene tetrahydromethanopterin reductase-like flavin-dependent oxidoreductase (luciferase family)